MDNKKYIVHYGVKGMKWDESKKNHRNTVTNVQKGAAATKKVAMPALRRQNTVNITTLGAAPVYGAGKLVDDYHKGILNHKSQKLTKLKLATLRESKKAINKGKKVISSIFGTSTKSSHTTKVNRKD